MIKFLLNRQFFEKLLLEIWIAFLSINTMLIFLWLIYYCALTLFPLHFSRSHLIESFNNRKTFLRHNKNTFDKGSKLKRHFVALV